MWLEPGRVSRGIAIFVSFAWPLSFSTCVCVWGGGGDLDGLAFRPHLPTNYGRQMRVQSPLTGAVPSYRTVCTSATLDYLSRGGGGAKPLGWFTCLGVDYPGP
jgi:hypothetical protein